MALPRCSVNPCENLADPRWYVPMPACDGHGTTWPEEIESLRARVKELEAEIRDHAKWAEEFANDPKNGAVVRSERRAMSAEVRLASLAPLESAAREYQAAADARQKDALRCDSASHSDWLDDTTRTQERANAARHALLAAARALPEEK